MAPLKLKKQVKKRFFSVDLPAIKKEIELYAVNLEDLDKRFVKIDMSNQLKGRSIELKFTIHVDNGKAYGKPIESKLMTTYIRRATRKGTDYAEDSFIVQTKDHRTRIKPLLITRKRVSKKVLKGIRKEANKYLSENLKDKTFETILQEIMMGKLQKDLSLILKKIYPLSLCEFKFFGIEELKEHELYEQEKEEEIEQEKEENPIDTKEEDSENKPKPKKTTKKKEVKEEKE